MKIKVCGMKYNPGEVARLLPDYLGFIFWEGSPRNFDQTIPKLPDSIKKIGVFVDSKEDFVVEKIKTHQLDGIQLHGRETPAYIQNLKGLLQLETINLNNDNPGERKSIQIIKVFSVKNRFDFSKLNPYEPYVDYFLFDTKGKLPGGNGFTFDWKLLECYPSDKPFFLSGGIGMESLQDLRIFRNSEASKKCFALDINSKFEIKPGYKDIEKLKQFIEKAP